MKSWLVIVCCVGFCSLASSAGAQTREEKVRNDRKKVEAEGFWIYNDLAKGFDEAKKSGKPLLVVLRCIPCEECVKLDDELIDQNPRVRPLLDKFVCVRLISTNGLDLSLFQFDTDQSFAVFLLNADRTIYGRFGTRSARKEWEGDVSVAGLAGAMEGALDLHRRYPEVKGSLAAKTGPAPDFPSPEKYPQLSGKYGRELNYSGNVVQSCIHCHQIGDAQRDHFRKQPGGIPDNVLFQYPHPKILGLILDPTQRAVVKSVAKGSLSEAAGFQAGDSIESLEGQPLLSIADVQWVLHHAPADGATLKAVVRRGADSKPLELKLPSGWRKQDDLAWRASTWMLRRTATGGIFSKPLSDEERLALKIPAGTMALRVEHVGQFSPHDAAKRAGVVKGDILVSFDGQTNLLRETDVLVWSLEHRKPGETVELVIVRDGQRKTLSLTIPS
jgi:hypothetical protein